MLASFPARMLNQKSSDSGVFNRFKLDPSRSSLDGEVYGHALSLREAVEHAFQRLLAANARLLDAAIRLPWELAESLVHLHPAGLDCVCGAERAADVMRPHIGG